jgi:hypothetical protein
VTGETVKSAVISACGRYRYHLGRRWADGPTLPFVMLNPSTADATIDDPTIRRCMGFARDRGFGSIAVVNIFALRATDPADMRAHPSPIGDENDAYLAAAFALAVREGAPIIAAWGVHGVFRDRGRQVAAFAKSAGAPLQCLGVTKEGHPRHPLYVRGDQPFVSLPS